MSPAVSTPTGTTALYGLVGDPVAHSLSPALHHAAFVTLGVDAVSVALRVRESGAPLVASAVRDLGVAGLSVTMPLKAAVLGYCDEATDVARRLGATNCIWSTDAGVRADSTDGEGLLRAIVCATGRSPDGLTCAVLGAGGAARAAIDALSGAGAAAVLVVARRGGSAEQAAAEIPRARAATLSEARDAQIIVQATPVGMDDTQSATAPALLDAAELSRGQVAVDLVYHPRVTRWLAGATAAGATPVQGVEVLVHQARGALERWLRCEVPLDPLHHAAGLP